MSFLGPWSWIVICIALVVIVVIACFFIWPIFSGAKLARNYDKLEQRKRGYSQKKEEKTKPKKVAKRGGIH